MSAIEEDNVVTFDQMMDAQDLLLHGLESRTYKFVPKVLELVLA